MISKFRDFIRISFVRDVGILQVSKFFSIFLTIVSSIILARLLHPELYGLYGLIFAFVGLVGIFIDWGGNYASLTLLAENYAKKNKEEIKNILVYFVKITLLGIGIVGVIILVFSPFLTEIIYGNSQIGDWARVVLMATFLGIFYTGVVIVLQVIRKISQLAFLEVFNKFVYVLLPISFVVIGWGLTGLVWAHFLSSFIFLILSLLIYRSLTREDNLLPNVRKIFSDFNKVRIKRYFKFGFLIAVDKNLGRLASFLPIIFLGIFTIPQDIAYFKIAFAYVTIPVMALNPISRLLAVQLPKSKNYGKQILKEHFFRTTIYSGIISILLAIPFVLLAPYLIEFFYGVDYIPSIKLVYYLAILNVLSGFGVGLGSFYRTINKMKTSIIVNIGQVIMMMLLILVLVEIYSPLMAIILALVISAAVFLFLQFFIVKNIIKEYEEN